MVMARVVQREEDGRVVTVAVSREGEQLCGHGWQHDTTGLLAGPSERHARVRGAKGSRSHRDEYNRARGTLKHAKWY